MLARRAFGVHKHGKYNVGATKFVNELFIIIRQQAQRENIPLINTQNQTLWRPTVL